MCFHLERVEKEKFYALLVVGERERVWGQNENRFGRQSSLAWPVRDRARATEMQRRASGSRDCRRSSSHMKTSRQAQDTNAPNHALQCGGVADFERKACTDMEGTNGREVAFNGLVENGTIFAGKMGGPEK
jgi:hypothetical protein